MTKAAGGSGTASLLPAVSDDQGQISCGADCTGRYAWSCDEYGDCTYTPATLSAPPSDGWQVSFSGCDTNGSTCTIDEPMHTSTTPQEVNASFHDVQAPSVGFVSPPPSGTHVRQVQLTVSDADNDKVKRVAWSYAASGSAVSFDDGAAVTDPGGTVAHTFNVAGPDGTYTFRALAEDYSGNQSVATINLVVDRTTSVTLTDGPDDGATIAAPPVFRFITEADATVRCSVDGEALRACSGDTEDALPALADGSHTWVGEAQDTAGNTATITRHFTVDTTGPTLVVDQGPANGATVTSGAVAFGFTAEDGASVACSLDGEAYRACSGPGTDEVTHLTDGRHVWQARAIDAAGNTTVVTRGFTVALPVPHITTGIKHRWAVKHGRTKVILLRTGKLPAGARVVVSCKGAHRPFARRTLRPSARHVVDLRPTFHKPLAAGVTVTIAMVDHGYIGRAFRFTTRRHGQPAYTTVTLPKS